MAKNSKLILIINSLLLDFLSKNKIHDINNQFPTLIFLTIKV